MKKTIVVLISAAALYGFTGHVTAAPTINTGFNTVELTDGSGDKLVAEYEAFCKRYKAAIASLDKNDPTAMIKLAELAAEQAKLADKIAALDEDDLTPEQLAKINKLNLELTQALQKVK